MCNPASFIVTRERALFCPTDSHEDIIKRHKLDDGIRGDFVRVELSPPYSKFDLPVSDWIFNTDQDDVPDWYSAKWAREICEMEIDAWWDGRVINHCGSLYLRGTQVTALPDGLSVGGNLDLRGTQVTALPEGLSVGGSLDLMETQVTALPEGLSVGGSLYLRGTQVTALPEGLSVGGSLDLMETQVTALPEGLSVGGSLYLMGTQVTSWPKHLCAKVIR